MKRTIMILVVAAATALARAQSNKPTSPAHASPGASSSQAGQPPSSTPQKSADSGSTVAASQPVITIHGVCDNLQKNAGGTEKDACATVLTKEQFETLVNSLNPSNQAIAPPMRLKLAQAYVELLAFSEAAQKAGIETTPGFKEVMRVVRMRTLTDMFQRNLQEKFRNASPAEMEDYYNKNLPKFQEVKLHRVFIPRNNPAAPNKEEFEKKAGQMANEIRERLAKGEDPDALEKEAYTALGLEAKPLNTDFGTRRKGMLPPQLDQEISSLEPGGASNVEPEAVGFLIYKVESRQTLPLDRVKDEISRDLFRRKLDEENTRIKASVHADYNDAYFGPANQSPAPPPPSPAPPK